MKLAGSVSDKFYQMIQKMNTLSTWGERETCLKLTFRHFLNGVLQSLLNWVHWSTKVQDLHCGNFDINWFAIFPFNFPNLQKYLHTVRYIKNIYTLWDTLDTFKNVILCLMSTKANLIGSSLLPRKPNCRTCEGTMCLLYILWFFLEKYYNL